MSKKRNLLKEFRQGRKTKEVIAVIHTNNYGGKTNQKIYLSRLVPKTEIAAFQEDNKIFLIKIFTILVKKHVSLAFPLIEKEIGTLEIHHDADVFIGLDEVKKGLRKLKLELFIPLLAYVKKF